MIPDAIEVRLKPKERAVLEARLRAATTEQRQLLRIRIVLEAADGSGTREIARELDTTPTTVSLWRGRFARERLDGLEDLPRSGTPPIYSEATDKRIRAVLDRPPPKGFARWNGPLIAKALGDVDVQYVWRSLRKQKIDLGGRKSWCESNDPEFASQGCRCGRPLHGAARQCRRPVRRRETVDPGAGACAGLSEAAERTRADGAQPRLQAARHNDPVRRVRGRDRQGHGPPTRSAGAARSSSTSWTRSSRPIPRGGSRSSSTI